MEISTCLLFQQMNSTLSLLKINDITVGSINRTLNIARCILHYASVLAVQIEHVSP